MKITLNSLTSGFLNLLHLNENFTLIQDDLNDKVLYRDPPAGETNTMQTDLDMNSNSINNVDQLRATTLYLGGVQVAATDLSPIVETTFPVGAAATPGLAVATDLDTGLYSPAANTLAASTGGTERLRISSTGLDVTGDLSVDDIDCLTITGTSLTASGTVTAATLGATAATFTGLTVSGTVSLPSFTIATGSVATTAAALDNSTKVATTAYVDAAVTAAAVPAGRVLQRIYSEFGSTSITGTTPIDGTPPLVTDGTAVTSGSITCSNAANKIRATLIAPFTLDATSSNRRAAAHLHKDSADAFVAAPVESNFSSSGSGQHSGVLTLCREITAGSTVAITISARAGRPGGGTTLTLAPETFGSTCNAGVLILEEIQS